MSLYVEVLRMKAALQKYRQRRCCEVGGTTLNFYLKGERTKQRETENGKLLVTHTVSIHLQSHYLISVSIESRRVFSEKKIFEKLKNVSSCVHNSRGKMCIIIFFITGHTVSIHLSIYRVIISIYTVPKSFFRKKSFLKN